MDSGYLTKYECEVTCGDGQIKNQINALAWGGQDEKGERCVLGKAGYGNDEVVLPVGYMSAQAGNMKISGVIKVLSIFPKCFSILPHC